MGEDWSVSRSATDSRRSNRHGWNGAIFTSVRSHPEAGGDTLSDTDRHRATPRFRRTFTSNHRERFSRGKREKRTALRRRSSLGNAPAIRRNKRNVLHLGANEKVPRRTKSPRSFISREKPRVELGVSEKIGCSCG